MIIKQGTKVDQINPWVPGLSYEISCVFPVVHNWLMFFNLNLSFPTFFINNITDSQMFFDSKPTRVVTQAQPMASCTEQSLAAWTAKITKRAKMKSPAWWWTVHIKMWKIVLKHNGMISNKNWIKFVSFSLKLPKKTYDSQNPITEWSFICVLFRSFKYVTGFKCA